MPDAKLWPDSPPGHSERNERILARYEAGGVSYDQIAKDEKLSRARIQQIVHRGWRRRREIARCSGK